MALFFGSGHSDIPNSSNSQRNGSKSNVGRKSANYHPQIWGDRFTKPSLDELKPDAQAQQRANELKEDVKRMLGNVNDPQQELNLIDAIQRLGVAYHFESDIESALLRMYNSFSDGKDNTDDLHTVALRFRLFKFLVRKIDVFNKFKDGEGSFKKSLVSDVRGLLSLYEAAYMGINGEDILDEAIAFTREKLELALPHLDSPLSTLVELALELPLRKRVERLKSRYYISIYQQEKGNNDILLEFAKLDFNLLQLLHQKELKEILMWDQSAIDQLPDYMKVHFCALLDAVEQFEDELAREEKSYRISYLKEAFKEVSKHYFIEMEWLNSGYMPTLEEYMSVALITGAYFMLILVSYVGMGNIATKEAFEWAKNKPKLLKAASIVCRFKDDIQTNQLEQMRGHVASCIQIYMKKHGITYDEACQKFRGMAADAWKDINKECLKPTEAPMPLLMRAVNFARVIEVLYQHRDGYTNSTHETKEFISFVLVEPIPIEGISN